MHEDARTLITRWFEEVWNKQRREAIAELLTAEATLYEGGTPSSGPEGFYPFFDRMQATFTGLHVTIHDGISEGDKACVRWTCKMKHTGPGLGVPPTDKWIEVTGISLVRAKDGKLVEGWQNWDMLALLEQIQGKDEKAATYIAAV